MMEDEDIEFDDLMISTFLLLDANEPPTEKKRLWVRNTFKQRQKFGQFHTLYDKMRNLDRQNFFRYVNFIWLYESNVTSPSLFFWSSVTYIQFFDWINLEFRNINRSSHRDYFRKYLFFSSSRSTFFWSFPGDLMCSPNRYRFSKSTYIATEQIPIFQKHFFLATEQITIFQEHFFLLPNR